MTDPTAPRYPEDLVPTGSVAPASNAHLMGPVGLVIAGLLGLIGGLLPWASISFPAAGASQSIQGPMPFTEGSAGPWRTIAVVLGAIILITAARYLFGRRNRRLLGLAAVFSLLLLGVGVFKIVDLYRQAENVYQQMDDLVAKLPAGAPSFSFRDFVHIDPGAGLWMVAASGLLGIVFALFVLLRTPKPEDFQAVPGRHWLPPVPPPTPPVRPAAQDTPPASQSQW
jgi:hypothetical protein